MADPVEAVQGERQRHKRLQQYLGDDGERAKSSHQGSRFQVPSQSRRDEIRHGEEVQSARQGNAGYTVQATEIPGYLGTVDGQVRRHWPLQTLVCENLVGFSLARDHLSGRIAESVSCMYVESACHVPPLHACSTGSNCSGSGKIHGRPSQRVRLLDGDWGRGILVSNSSSITQGPTYTVAATAGQSFGRT